MLLSSRLRWAHGEKGCDERVRRAGEWTGAGGRWAGSFPARPSFHVEVGLPEWKGRLMGERRMLRVSYREWKRNVVEEGVTEWSVGEEKIG